jgi:class 3 adenylate cyclase
MDEQVVSAENIEPTDADLTPDARELLSLSDDALASIGGREKLRELLLNQVTYTRGQQETEFERAIESMYEKVNGAKFFKPVLDNFPARASMYERAKYVLEKLGTKAALENPYAEHLKMNPDGTFPKTALDVLIVYTDIRGFSKLSHELQDDIVDCLQRNYFVFVARIIQKFNMKVFDTAGDALCIYCTDTYDEHGKKIKTKEENGMEFSIELNKWTNILAAVWKKYGLGIEQGVESEKRVPLFETGIGVTTGRLFIRDMNDSHVVGVIADVQQAMNVLMEKDYPAAEFGENKIGVPALSEDVNRGARLEALDPVFDSENIVLDHFIWHRLPMKFRDKLISLGVRELKGVGQCKLYALPRERLTDKQFDEEIRPLLEEKKLVVPSIPLDPPKQPIGGADGPGDTAL